MATKYVHTHYPKVLYSKVSVIQDGKPVEKVQSELCRTPEEHEAKYAGWFENPSCEIETPKPVVGDIKDQAITELESDLIDAGKENDTLRAQVAALTAQLAAKATGAKPELPTPNGPVKK